MHLRVQILPGTEDPLLSVCPVLSGFLHLQKVSVPHPQQLFCTSQQSICMKKGMITDHLLRCHVLSVIFQ